tara:strand:+ start:2772 stop:3446 length:675 start_codon:yes stop_codon:yes gene_type:complete
VSGKGCGKGSCVKKGTKKRTKRVRRRARRKARGTKRRYKNIRNVTMRESLAIQNRLNRRKSKKKKKSLSRKIKKGVGKIKKMLTLPEKLQRPFDPETGYFGKTQRQIRRSMKMYSKRKYKKRSKRKSKRKSKKSKMSCNRVKKSYRRGKKFMVKACSKGKTKLIHFGATGYGHNYSKGARKSFRARHRCKSAKNKLTARYWSCKHSWTRGGSKRRCPKGRRCKR